METIDGSEAIDPWGYLNRSSSLPARISQQRFPFSSNLGLSQPSQIQSMHDLTMNSSIKDPLLKALQNIAITQGLQEPQVLSDRIRFFFSTPTGKITFEFFVSQTHFSIVLPRFYKPLRGKKIISALKDSFNNIHMNFVGVQMYQVADQSVFARTDVQFLQSHEVISSEGLVLILFRLLEAARNFLKAMQEIELKPDKPVSPPRKRGLSEVITPKQRKRRVLRPNHILRFKTTKRSVISRGRLFTAFRAQKYSFSGRKKSLAF
jgi:hypothetical protein